MPELKKVLMERDDLTANEADNIIADLKDQLYEDLADGDLDSAYHICEEVGLEPDYLLDLI